MFNTVDTASECSNATMALIALCRSSSSTASSSLSRFHDDFTVFLSSQTNLQNIHEFVDVWAILKEQNIFCQLHPFRIAFAWPQYMDWPFFPDISPISNNLFRYSFTLTGNLVFFLCFLRAYPTLEWSAFCEHEALRSLNRSTVKPCPVVAISLGPQAFLLASASGYC